MKETIMYSKERGGTAFCFHSVLYLGVIQFHTPGNDIFYSENVNEIEKTYKHALTPV